MPIFTVVFTACVYVCVRVIIQKISIVHNPELKAEARCAHRKTLNALPIKNKNKAHHNYHTMDDP